MILRIDFTWRADTALKWGMWTLQLHSQVEVVRQQTRRLAYLLIRNAYLDTTPLVPAAASAQWSAWLPQSPAARGDALVTVLTQASEVDGAADACLLHRLASQHHLDQDIHRCLRQVSTFQSG